MRRHPARTGLACLVGAHAMLTFVLPGMLLVTGEILSAVLVGVVIGQVASLSFWAVLGPSRFVDRVPTTGFLAILMCFLLLLGFRLIEETAPAQVAAVMGLSVLGAYLSCLLPFWLARRFLRWRLVSPESPPQAEQGHTSQFSIGRLLLWTAGIGASLAAAKWLVPIHDWTPTSRVEIDIFFPVAVSSVFVTLHVAAVMPCMWVALRVEQDRITWAFLLAVYCAGISVLDVIIAAIPFGAVMIGEMYIYVFLINAGLISSMAGNLTYVRLLGYELPPQAWPPPNYFKPAKEDSRGAAAERAEPPAAETGPQPASAGILPQDVNANPAGNDRPASSNSDGRDD